MAVLPEMDGVLNTMASRPLAERLGAIDGVMVKTFKKWTDQRGYFIEQLKRGDLDDEGRPFLPDQPVRADVAQPRLRPRRQPARS